MKRLFTLLLALSFTLLSANESDLERAYAKEFAYLKAQKEMLQKRLNEIRKSNAASIADAKSDLEKLQNSVLAKNAEAEKLSDELYRSQQHSQIMIDDTALIESVLMQATSTLEPYNIKVSASKENYQNALSTIFTQSEKLITSLSGLEVSKGKFYAQDGSELEGDIVRVGNIAMYGISGDTASALVPAGEHKFKIWNAPEAAASAKALATGGNIDPLNIFIFENDQKEIEDIREKSVIDVIDSGGVIGWVIVILGAVGVILALLRSVFLVASSSTTDTLAKDTLAKLLEEGANSALEYLKSKKGSTARVLKATIRNLDRDREHIEDIVSEAILHESGRLDKFGSMILVIAAVAPLLGLLGTVTGMIATFDIITEFGTGDPKLLSSGISIALVTTELGLIVAIPILMIGNLLGGWAEKVKDHMEHSALHIINEYNKQK
ncbi:MAG: MotA/TolQ/ExbB proton channel family protein [Epsilonproteobacteria bacterium]|nr:MotA/TolQ/ExbB proton channel family protein [Campylobacterota bacterium]